MDELIENSKWKFIPGVSGKSKMSIGKWAVDFKGNICYDGYYHIDHVRLNEGDWVIHLMQKGWFDFNEFMPIYLQACVNAGLNKVMIKTNY